MNGYSYFYYIYSYCDLKIKYLSTFLHSSELVFATLGTKNTSFWNLVLTNFLEKSLEKLFITSSTSRLFLYDSLLVSVLHVPSSFLERLCENLMIYFLYYLLQFSWISFRHKKKSSEHAVVALTWHQRKLVSVAASSQKSNTITYQTTNKTVPIKKHPTLAKPF